MAIPPARLIQDDNLNILFMGGAILGEKTDVSKEQKKGGGLGSRKALNDLSNSTKPSTFKVSKKHSSNNVIDIEKDAVATSRTPYAVGGKANASKRPQKRQSGGRKALGDLTNSEKPSLQKVTNKSQDKKLSVISEEFAIENEGFLHNHQECIKAQRIFMEIKCFQDLDDGHPFLPLASELRSPSPKPLEMWEPLEMEMEMEDTPALMFDEDDDLKGFNSPASFSPISPRLSSFRSSFWEDYSPDFRLIELPK